MAKPAKIAVVPPKFSGRLNEDAFKYLQNFQLAAISNVWTDDLKIKAIPNYLTDTALNWYHSYVRDRNAAATLAAGAPATAKITWTEFVDDIQKAFKTVASKEVAEQKLNDRKQQIGEGPEDYVYSMLDLLNDFNSDMQDESRIRYIIKGLRASYLEKIHFLAPKTIPDLIAAIRRIAETQFMIDQNQSSNIITNQIQPIQEILQSFKAEFTNAINSKLEKVKQDLQPNLNHTQPQAYPISNPYNMYAQAYNFPHFPLPGNFQPRNFTPRTPCTHCNRSNHASNQCFYRPQSNPSVSCTYCKKPNHNISQCRILASKQSGNTCYKCNNPGHFARDCSESPKNLQGWKPQPQAQPPNPKNSNLQTPLPPLNQ